MRRALLLALAALAPVLALAADTRIVQPNGSGTVESPRATAANGLQVDVTRVQGANTTTSCAMNGAATVCQVALLGKSSCGIQVTTANSPTGITTAPEISLDGGTTWKATTFDNGNTYAKTATLTAFAVSDTYQIILSGGATHCRIHNTARTSGDYTAQLTASDSQDPSAAFAGPVDALPPPAGAMVMGMVQAEGAQSASTAGNTGHLHTDTQGRLLVRADHPNRWSCTAAAVTAMTQCMAAPGANLSLYVTDFFFSNGSTTAINVNVASATGGSNCATSTSNVTPPMSVASNAGAGSWYGFTLTTPIKITANQPMCCRTSGSTAFNCIVAGFTAP